MGDTGVSIVVYKDVILYIVSEVMVGDTCVSILIACHQHYH